MNVAPLRSAPAKFAAVSCLPKKKNALELLPGELDSRQLRLQADRQLEVLAIGLLLTLLVDTIQSHLEQHLQREDLRVPRPRP